jgi:hypothetical protein
LVLALEPVVRHLGCHDRIQSDSGQLVNLLSPAGGGGGTTSSSPTFAGVSWWGWAAAILLVIWAADSATLRPVVILALVVFILYQFVHSMKGAQ